MKAVILAGGTGTRLWPMSRDLKPKQFHSFVGRATMLQQTFERLSFLQKSDIFVATNIQYQDLVKKQLPGLARQNLIIEPAMRDTGPCICFAAHRLAALGFQQEVMAIIYADHLIQKPEAFQKALSFGENYIKINKGLGIIAVRAKYPNPHLGYLRIGAPVKTAPEQFPVYKLERFVEKPTYATAKKFLTSYKYLWNTGLYLWEVKTILEKFKKHALAIYKNTKFEKTYVASQKISIDYAVMEKVSPKGIRVIPAELGWNDIGNWAALHEELAAEEKANVSIGEHFGIDTEGSVIMGKNGKLIVTYGLKNIVVVDTEEALLIMPKEKSSNAKKIIEELKKKNKARFL